MLGPFDAFCGGCALGIYKAFYVSATRILFTELGSCAVIQSGSDGHGSRAVCRNRHRGACAEGYAHVQRRGPGVHIVAFVLLEVHNVGEDILGKEVSGQGICFFSCGQVVEGEGECVLAVSLRVISQFYLDFAIGVGFGGVGSHQDIRVSGNGLTHVGQAGTLLQNGVVAIGSIAVVFQHRNCGGHQQTLGQCTGGKTGLLCQLFFPDVLLHQGSHTGHLRRRHGGAGHGLIGGTASYRAVHGIDIAARGGDLGLHLQGSGNAPAGEGTHGVVFVVVDGAANAFLYKQGALIVKDVAGFVGHRRCIVFQDGAFCLCDGDNGLGMLVVRQIHVNTAWFIVVNDCGNGACFYGKRAFFCKAEGTTRADSHSALQSVSHSGPILGGAKAVNQDVGLLTSEGGQGVVAIGSTLCVENGMIPHRKI